MVGVRNIIQIILENEVIGKKKKDVSISTFVREIHKGKLGLDIFKEMATNLSHYRRYSNPMKTALKVYELVNHTGNNLTIRTIRNIVKVNCRLNDLLIMYSQANILRPRRYDTTFDLGIHLKTEIDVLNGLDSDGILGERLFCAPHKSITHKDHIV